MNRIVSKPNTRIAAHHDEKVEKSSTSAKESHLFLRLRISYNQINTKKNEQKKHTTRKKGMSFERFYDFWFLFPFFISVYMLLLLLVFASVRCNPPFQIQMTSHSDPKILFHYIE